MRGLKFLCAAVLLAGMCYAQNESTEDEGYTLGTAIDKNCKEHIYKGEVAYYMSGYTCFYPKQTILQTYLNYKNKNIKAYPDVDSFKSLRSKLEVGKDYNDTIEEGYLWINYKWHGKNELVLEMQYAGGVDYITFRGNDNGTEEVLEGSAD
jgi:hypothetical protein